MNMIPEKAYSIAMSAAYIPVPRRKTGGYDGKPEKSEPNWAYDALHPSFWECMGKALGWPLKSKAWHCSYVEATWAVKAKEFYDLILSGSDTTAFWNDLLGN